MCTHYCYFSKNRANLYIHTCLWKIELVAAMFTKALCICDWLGKPETILWQEIRTAPAMFSQQLYNLSLINVELSYLGKSSGCIGVINTPSAFILTAYTLYIFYFRCDDKFCTNTTSITMMASIYLIVKVDHRLCWCA